MKGVGGALTALAIAGELHLKDDGVDHVAVGTLLLLHGANPSHRLCTTLVAHCREVGLGPMSPLREVQIMNFVTLVQWDKMKEYVIDCEERGWSVRFTAADSVKRKILQCIIQ